MDHRAIVWCHHVLAKIRQILHIMAIKDDLVERQRQLETLLPSKDYSAALAAQRVTFRVSKLQERSSI
jgi:hypothetical protein